MKQREKREVVMLGVDATHNVALSCSKRPRNGRNALCTNRWNFSAAIMSTSCCVINSRSSLGSPVYLRRQELHSIALLQSHGRAAVRSTR
jgi:hypothetical protein